MLKGLNCVVLQVIVKNHGAVEVEETSYMYNHSKKLHRTYVYVKTKLGYEPALLQI